MRLSALLLAGAIAVGGSLVTPAQAFVPDRVQAAPSPNIVQVDRRCGRGFHYVPRHRDRYGRLIRGHCRRNR